MATTLHLGDCQNGCLVCSERYHEGRETCDTCGQELYTCTDCEGIFPLDRGTYDSEHGFHCVYCGGLEERASA